VRAEDGWVIGRPGASRSPAHATSHHGRGVRYAAPRVEVVEAVRVREGDGQVEVGGHVRSPQWVVGFEQRRGVRGVVGGLPASQQPGLATDTAEVVEPRRSASGGTRLPSSGSVPQSSGGGSAGADRAESRLRWTGGSDGAAAGDSRLAPCGSEHRPEQRSADQRRQQEAGPRLHHHDRRHLRPPVAGCRPGSSRGCQHRDPPPGRLSLGFPWDSGASERITRESAQVSPPVGLVRPWFES
jgi:hypothetical protein